MDLPTPEYDRLGNMPMFRYEVGLRSLPAQSPDDIIGWKERYYYCKRRAPRVSMAFMHQGCCNMPTAIIMLLILLLLSLCLFIE